MKKLLTAVGIAAVIILGGSSAANATYPDPGDNVEVSNPAPAVGQPITITATGLGDLPTVVFSVNAPGATLASIVVASTGGSSVTKPVVDGTASAQFTATTPGDYTILVSDLEGNVVGSVGVTVAAAGAGSGDGAGDGSGLPPTGGTVPAAVIWAGVGAVGLGGIAVAAVAARRRAAKN
jgi:hypothetical protein